MLRTVLKFIAVFFAVALVAGVIWLSFRIHEVSAHTRGEDVLRPNVTPSVLQYLPDSNQTDSFPALNGYTDLAGGFAADSFFLPSIKYRPWTRWWWPGNNVDRLELIREVQMFYDEGFGGMEIQPFTSGIDPEEMARGSVFSYDTDIFYENLGLVLSAAHHRGLKVDLNAGSGWPSGGSQISIDDNLKTLAFGESHILGGKKIDIPLPAPKLPGAYYMLGAIEAYMGGTWNNIVDFFPEKARLLTLIGSRTLNESRTYVAMDFTDFVQLNPDSLFLLDEFITDSNRLVWDAPKGYWKIIAVYGMPDGERPMLNAKSAPGFVNNHFDSLRVIANYHYLFGKRTGLERHYGKGLRAIFNDSFEFKADRHFTDDFLEEFKKRRGYDLVPYLPVVLQPGRDNFLFQAIAIKSGPEYVITPEDSRIRYDYSRTVSELFSERFLKPTTDWAGKRGLHSRVQAYGMETDLIRAAGMADIPETEQLYAGGTEMFLKVAASGALLYNRPVVSAEALVHQDMGFTMSPQRMKAGIDKLFAAGVNHVVFHGTPYRNKQKAYGETGWLPFISPQYPVSFSSVISEANPYWRHQRTFNRYVSRCQYVLRQGKPETDILIYYPFLGFPTSFSASLSHEESYFLGKIAEMDPAVSPGGTLPWTAVDPVTQWLEKVWPIIQELDKRGLTWHWVNDASIQEIRLAEKGMEIRGNPFQALLLLDAPTIEAASARHLTLLANQGGRIIVSGEPPQKQPGFHNYEENDLMISRYLREIITPASIRTPEDMANYLTGFPVYQDIGYAGSYNFLQHTRRKQDDGSVFVFYSNTLGKDRFFEITLNEKYEHVYWMDPVTGKIHSAKPFHEQRYQGYLKAYGSVILYCKKGPPIQDSLVVSPGLAERSLISDRNVNTRGLSQWDIIVAGSDVPHGEIIFEDTTLFEWRAVESLRYVSSEGLYTTYFELGDTLPGFKYLLDLGTVYGTADVKVNTEPAGSLIFAPYRVDITRWLIPGPNTIEVWITPPLRNRYLGKAKQGDPMYKELNGEKFAPLPAGLIGPVNVWELSE
ncbi:MAG: glycosyl hydrolase [Bacteroidia bacterium]